jgi:hypothetical protein
VADYIPYWQLLRDPRWQRKRLEVMERAGFACEDCGETTKTLNVHHTHYVKGRKPWEYQTSELRCLCEDCHASTSEKIAEINRRVGALSPDILDEIIGFVRGQELINSAVGSDPDESLLIFNFAQARGAASAFGITGDGIDAAHDHAIANGWCVTYRKLIQIWNQQNGVADA